VTLGALALTCDRSLAPPEAGYANVFGTASVSVSLSLALSRALSLAKPPDLLDTRPISRVDLIKELCRFRPRELVLIVIMGARERTKVNGLIVRTYRGWIVRAQLVECWRIKAQTLHRERRIKTRVDFTMAEAVINRAFAPC
jgi:hypothetical protein